MSAYFNYAKEKIKTLKQIQLYLLENAFVLVSEDCMCILEGLHFKSKGAQNCHG